MKISMIVAYGKNWQIGLNNAMPWHIREDFKNFKQITLNHHILMGRKTFESIGKPLADRTSLILSRGNFSHEDVNVFTSVQEAFDFARIRGEEELFVIGGANIYASLFPFVDKMYLTQVDYDGEADAYLPKIDFSSWELIEQREYAAIVDECNVTKSPAWDFKVWVKKN
ncbi:MAG: dihydrofolate reductase [Sulfurospirillum sp.]|nr:dihydrofolate reductase [Sulfurospirillum sp.]